MQRLTDRTALDRNRARADGSAWFLYDLAASLIHEKLRDVNRTFTRIAVVSGQPGYWANEFPKATHILDTDTLDLNPNSYDLVLHLMTLHWADDPVGQLIQSKRALIPDGAFLSVAFAGETLTELRQVLTHAESEITGGLSPRVAPMADLRAMGGLLQRAGFALPVADSYRQNVSYGDIYKLAKDLRAMGEGNALDGRLRQATRKTLFQRAAEIYAQHHSEGGRLTATFELAFLTGWAPDETQPKPLRPGSAKMSLSDALKFPETGSDN